DWNRGEDGLLHILARGTRRFRVQDTRLQADGLNLGEVEMLPEDALLAVPTAQKQLPEILRQVLLQLEAVQEEINYADAGWVGNRLAEVLPISLLQRQYLLETEPLKRLEILQTLVQSLTVN
ncbi:MAG TPA: LON peptidase substrate-binding domain-containing protein, partial [Gammaproteobacteria bacterium]